MTAYFHAFGRLNRDVKLFLAGFGLTAFAYFGIMGVLFNLYLARLGFGASQMAKAAMANATATTNISWLVAIITLWLCTRLFS